MPQKRTYKGAQVIAIIIAILLLCVAGFCAYLLIHNQQQKAEQKEMFATIAEKVDAAETSARRIYRKTAIYARAIT